jgi:hypothetical protein
MDQAIRNPLFIESLLKCYGLKSHARNRVVQEKIFYRQLLEVFSLKEQMRQQLHEQEEEKHVHQLRRKTWLMIVRNHLPKAYMRKMNSCEQKLIKTRSIAHNCVSQSETFRKRSTKPQKETHANFIFESPPYTEEVPSNE